ncbi:hypothetical protein GLP24_09220 [Photobacterium carnosum]|nr:hypothetical protein [Photobacterium carnosum]
MEIKMNTLTVINPQYITANNISQKLLIELGLGSLWTTLRKYRTKLPCLSEHGLMEQNPVVNARTLHTQLKIKKTFSQWLKPKLEYLSQSDYCITTIPEVNTFEDKNLGGRPSIDYLLTVDAAKSIAMQTRTQEGQSVRDYFINMEKLVGYLMVWNSKRKPQFDYERFVKKKATEAAKADLSAMSFIDKMQKYIREMQRLVNQIAFGNGITSVERNLLNSEGQDKLNNAMTAFMMMAEQGLTLKVIANIFKIKDYKTAMNKKA